MSTVADADAWWHAQTPERRLKIFGWLAEGHHAHRLGAASEDQLEMPFPPEPERTDP